MNLVLDNKVIQADLLSILKQLRSEINNGKLKDIIDKGENILVTCPFHKDGREAHPSCQVYCGDASNLTQGDFHCFTCGEKGHLDKFIAKCFDQDLIFAKDWLIERFGSILNTSNYILPILSIEKKIPQTLDINTLDKYKYFHPYMFKRKLTEEIIRKFSIGYDEKTDCIVFPVWDEKDNLLFITKRSVKNKAFYIDKDADKPVYLLNYILKENHKSAYVMESQINALTGWVYGYPSCALFGTGTSKQYDILNKCGIKHFILCLDGDTAGRKGTYKLIKNLSKSFIVDVKVLPEGKDVNDLTKEEFDNLKQINSSDWLKSY